MTQYWRMQLHPSESANAMAHAVQSIGAGFIGLDFLGDPGDLRRADPATVKSTERNFFDFARRMQVGDLVLVVVHHFQFALATVLGEYNYISRPEHELGVWFRHFRRIDTRRTLYWADRVTNARKWEPITMTNTIQILDDHASDSYRLMDEWRAGAAGGA